MPIDYSRFAADRLLKRPRGYKYPVPNPEEEQKKLDLQQVQMPPGMEQLGEVPQIPAVKPYAPRPAAVVQPALKQPPAAAIGAASGALGGSSGAPVPPPATPPAPPPEPTPDKSTDSSGRTMAELKAGAQTSYEDPNGFKAAPSTPAPATAEAPPPTPDSEARTALEDLARKASEAQDLTDWKTGETQTAADKLAREQDAMKARMGGTDNPYAMLGGVAAQGEFLKRLGDINAKDVELGLQQSQQAAALWERLEQWNRENKPDIYAEWNPKLTAAFGAGYKINADGTVTVNGEPRELSEPEQELVRDYMAANGQLPGSPEQGVTDAAGAAAKDADLVVKLSGMDPDVDWSGGRHGPAIKQKVLAWMKANGGKIPNKRTMRDIYDSVGEGLPDKWKNRKTDTGSDMDIYGGPYGDEPAW